MSRRNRILLYGAAAFVVCVILIISTAYMQGADPFHPRSRHIWLLTLFAAFYVSFRGAKIVDKLMRKWQADGAAGKKRFGLFKSEYAIDKRMAARRERVATAKAKQDENNSDPNTVSETKND